jgi:hypothetical protein
MENIAIITPDGTLTEHEKNDDLLGQLQHACGGYVQAVDITGTLTMWVNEEGKLNGSAWNELATAIWHVVYGPTDTIFGTVVFTGGADEDGNTQGISSLDWARLAYIAEEYSKGGLAWA